jgi:hypothetical protein
MCSQQTADPDRRRCTGNAGHDAHSERRQNTASITDAQQHRKYTHTNRLSNQWYYVVQRRNSIDVQPTISTTNIPIGTVQPRLELNVPKRVRFV